MVIEIHFDNLERSLGFKMVIAIGSITIKFGLEGWRVIKLILVTL
jgi:hypothetical protein